MHAQHLASQIEFFLDTLARELRFLSALPSLRYGEREEKESDINAFSKRLEQHHVKTISLYDEIGKEIISTDSNMTGPDDASERLLVWAREKGSRGKVYMSEEIQRDP